VSGGELSRLLIALKTVLAERDRVPVLVFDEAEAGIGGETAYKVVEKLIELSGSHQLILVSHLSQIASKADSHWVIEKTSTKNSTYAEARDVLGEDRVEEISRMLGARGDKAALDKLARSFLNDV
jgi:DNA repair protein RecN (Recombination protein N)